MIGPSSISSATQDAGSLRRVKNTEVDGRTRHDGAADDHWSDRDLPDRVPVAVRQVEPDARILLYGSPARGDADAELGVRRSRARRPSDQVGSGAAERMAARG